MLTKKERYFLWNIAYAYDELLDLIHNRGSIKYFDPTYSPLIDKISNLCSKVLHLFEQPEFSDECGKDKRDELNQSNDIFNRIFSYGIKSKHGKISSKYYNDVVLEIPLSIYYDRKTNEYSYRYTPILNTYDFITDFDYIVEELIRLYSLRIKLKNKHNRDMRYVVKEDNTLYVKLIDDFKYIDRGLTDHMNIRTYELKDTGWHLTDLDKNIEIQVLPSK